VSNSQPEMWSIAGALEIFELYVQGLQIWEDNSKRSL
jgi:hypothetical protein